jgi:hypothetical protein
MDATLPVPAAAPRAAPDLRPASDAQASARQDRPPAALAPAHPPPCPAQQALALRGLLSEGPGAVEPVRRVLKPFGVEMLPAERRRDGDGPARRGAGEGPLNGGAAAADG